MSALFFADKQSQLPEPETASIRDRLIKSAGHWGIQGVVETLLLKVAADAADGQARLADSDFALVWEAENRKERHYPLRNGSEVKMASDWFGRFHQEFTFADKHTIASKILVKAAAFGAMVNNQELLDRCAGFGYCPAVSAAEAWEKRANLVRQRLPEFAEEAVKLAKSIRGGTFEARDQGRRIKMASLMDQFDRQTTLDKLYGDGGLERPEEVLFMITEKVAADFLGNHVQTTTGAVYEKMALDSLTIDHVRQWLGNELADAVGGVMLDTTKLAEIVPTLPRPEAAMFEQMATAAGIRTVAREKAAMDKGLTRTEMEDLAAQYGQGDFLNVPELALL